MPAVEALAGSKHSRAPATSRADGPHSPQIDQGLGDHLARRSRLAIGNAVLAELSPARTTWR